MCCIEVPGMDNTCSIKHDGSTSTKKVDATTRIFTHLEELLGMWCIIYIGGGNTNFQSHSQTDFLFVTIKNNTYGICRRGWALNCGLKSNNSINKALES